MKKILPLILLALCLLGCEKRNEEMLDELGLLKGMYYKADDESLDGSDRYYQFRFISGEQSVGVNSYQHGIPGWTWIDVDADITVSTEQMYKYSLNYPYLHVYKSNRKVEYVYKFVNNHRFKFVRKVHNDHSDNDMLKYSSQWDYEFYRYSYDE